MSLLKYLAVLVISIMAATVVSVGWPKFISPQRPTAVDYIHNILKDTPLARNTANVLGVADEKNIHQVDYKILARDMISGAYGLMEKKLLQTINDRVVIEILRRIDDLDPEQKEIISKAVCGKENDKGK